MCSGSLERNHGFLGPVKTVLPSFLSAGLPPSFLVWLGHLIFQWTVPRGLLPDWVPELCTSAHSACPTGVALHVPRPTLVSPRSTVCASVLWVFCRLVIKPVPLSWNRANWFSLSFPVLGGSEMLASVGPQRTEARHPG